MKFQGGDRVFYTTRRLKGTVLSGWFDGVENRYAVRTRLDVWSVPEASLEMQNSEEETPEISHPENEQNGDLTPAKG